MAGECLDVQARAACVRGREVWLARQQGGVTVCDSGTHQRLQEIPLPVDGKPTSQVRCLAAVHDDVWAATADGELLCINAAARQTVCSLRLPGSEKKAPIAGLCFVPSSCGGTGLLTVASSTGRVFAVNPLTRKVVLSLSTFAPCTAVTQCFQSIVVAGDEDGALYAWDLATAGPPIEPAATPESGPAGAATAKGVAPSFLHQASSSKVRHILFEPETESIWVARENGNIDVYAIGAAAAGAADGFQLRKRADAVGAVTGMVAVGGKVVASTFERKLVTLAAESANVLSVLPNAHKSFMHGLVKVTRTETAQLWTLGNDEAVREWMVDGCVCPASQPSRLSARTQTALALSPFTHLFAENAKLGVAAEGARAGAAVALEELRKAREEAQELRLRVMKWEETVAVKDQEIAAKTAQVKELLEAQVKLNKEAAEIACQVSAGERERAALQADLSRARDEATQARTASSNQAVEKSKMAEDLSRQKTESLQMEQRLRDAESKLATVQAENARLCQSMGSVATAQSAEKELQNHMMQDAAKTSQELQDAWQLNRVLSSVIASMEYTIRKKEEEDKDVVALLNAYRRKVADHVTDPFLSALLVATMVRHPDRFDLDCDAATKSVLLDRNGPFIQFVHSLRQTDPEAYEKLMSYLQQCTSAAGDAALSPESRQLLDTFVSLAAREGSLGEDAILALKRSIPTSVVVSGAQPVGSGSGVGPTPPSLLAGAGATVGTVPAAAPGAVSGGGAAAPGATTTTTTGSGVTFPGMSADAKADEEFVGASLLRELRSQRAVEDSYVKEQRAMFEFILTTRRALVECLVLLQKRTMSAQQVVEALTANATAAGGATSPSAPLSPSKAGRLLPLQAVFLGIVRELAELTSSVVSQYLTNSEKQRLNVQ